MASIEMKTMDVNQDNEAEEDDSENIENIKKIQDAFNCFDRSKSGRISIRVSILLKNTWLIVRIFQTQDLQSALRRAGLNPTESEVQDMTNQIDDGSGTLNSSDFTLLVLEKNK